MDTGSTQPLHNAGSAARKLNVATVGNMCDTQQKTKISPPNCHLTCQNVKLYSCVSASHTRTHTHMLINIYHILPLDGAKPAVLHAFVIN